MRPSTAFAPIQLEAPQRQDRGETYAPLLAKTHALILAALLGQSTLALADAPPFKITRFDESYAYLAGDSSEQSLEDRLKYIRLGDSGYLSLGGELRERFDRLDAAKFGIGAAADSYALQRMLLHGDLHLDDDRVRVFVQLGREDAFGKTPPYSPSDVDRLDVQNAFVDIRPDEQKRVNVRLGRQELLLNSTQRFVSVREGPNVRQSFDGARFTWSDTGLRVDAFATRPVKYEPGPFDDSADRTQAFYGTYASLAVGATETLDGYVFLLDRDNVRFGAAAGHEHRLSWGSRWVGTSGPVDHDFESMLQSGHVSGSEIRAWAIGLIGGYTFALQGKPRVGIELDSGSGDHDANDHRVGTFNPLFPKGAYFNETALTSWANLVMLRAVISGQPSSSTSISAGVFERWRQTISDAVYLQPYTALGPTLGNDERRVGGGIQLDGTWRVNRYLGLQAQALHQSAGPAIRAAGGHSLNFGMLIAQLRF